MLTYELQRSDEVDDYLAQKLSPLVPILIYGRSAAASPSCSKEEAVMFGWKDRLFKSPAFYLSRSWCSWFCAVSVSVSPCLFLVWF